MVVSRKLANTQVETCPMLNNGLMDRGQKDMVLRIDFRLGGHQESMIFSSITANNSGTGVSSGTIGADYFPVEGIIEVD